MKDAESIRIGEEAFEVNFQKRFHLLSTAF